MDTNTKERDSLIRQQNFIARHSLYGYNPTTNPYTAEELQKMYNQGKFDTEQQKEV